MPNQVVPIPKVMQVDPSAPFRVRRDAVEAINGYLLGKPVPAGITYNKVPDGEWEPGRFDRYRLVVTGEAITVTCHDEKALFCAMQTLRQLIEGDAIPCVTIDDWADYEWRAVMLDISRDRVPMMQTLRTLIELFASLKYNQLQLYMEHTFAYSGHEPVWEHASPLTRKDIKELEHHCNVRGIDLVPNQNSFGHMERWLMHPQYRHVAEMPDGFVDPWGVFRPISSTLAPTEPASLELIDDLYAQLLPMHASSLVNIGGDEPWELGQGRSAQACALEGLEHVYVRFLSRLHDIAEKYGKRVMVWADVLMRHPQVVDLLPTDVILADWGYEAGHPWAEECAILADSGYEYVLCTGNSAWNTFGGRWDNAKMNIERACAAGMAATRPPRGFIVTEWGDNGHLQQLPVGLPGFLLGSVAAWHAGAVPAVDVSQALSRALARHPGLVYGDDGARSVDEGVAKVLAQVVMMLGHIGELYGDSFPAIHNTTLLGALLLDHLAPYYADAIARCGGYRFEREDMMLKEVNRLLDRLAGRKTQNPLLLSELRWTCDMLRFATDLGKARLSHPNGIIGLARLPEELRFSLARRLSSLIDTYGWLWHRRSRPGGLADSVRRLSSLREALQGESPHEQ